MKKLTLFATIALLSGGITYADHCESGHHDGKDIVSTAVEAGKFNTLAAALKAGGLVEALQGKGPFTVFAPTDEAFAKLPKGTVEALLKPENKDKLVSILTFHVVSGNVKAADVLKMTGAKSLNGQLIDISTGYGVKVNGANVLKTDIACSNGTIHVIDSVILPEMNNIPQVATGAKMFNTLLAAAKGAGLVPALSGTGPITVFAPTDAAFAKLPKGTVEMLLKPENKDKLRSILLFHVVPGRVYAADALKAGSAKTLADLPVKIAVRGDKAFVQNATIIKTNIDASNGVIHVIDSVMIPQAQ